MVDDVYKEINRQRRIKNLGRLRIDKTMEGIMRRIPYTTNHQHSQIPALEGTSKKIQTHKVNSQPNWPLKIRYIVLLDWANALDFQSVANRIGNFAHLQLKLGMMI